MLLFMRLVVLVVPFLFARTTQAAEEGGIEAVYGIHLFFDEQEFVDVLTIRTDGGGVLSGNMHVPDDFDGPVQGLTISGNQLTFDLFVPKNASRPEDLVFHYEGKFFDAAHEQLTGFVTIPGDPAFVASFVGFRR